MVKTFWGYRQVTELFTDSIQERISVELLEQLTDMTARLEIHVQKAVGTKRSYECQGML